MNVQIQVMHEAGIIPTRGTPGSAGLDLYAAEPCGIPVGKWRLIDTGIAMSIPVDRVGLIWPRSGWAAKHGIDVLAGVIDSDYRDSIKVALINHGPLEFSVSPGDRIAQIIIQRYEHVELMAVDRLGETHRGTRGFGSTGT